MSLYKCLFTLFILEPGSYTLQPGTSHNATELKPPSSQLDTLDTKLGWLPSVGARLFAHLLASVCVLTAACLAQWVELLCVVVSANALVWALVDVFAAVLFVEDVLAVLQSLLQ